MAAGKDHGLREMRRWAGGWLLSAPGSVLWHSDVKPPESRRKLATRVVLSRVFICSFLFTNMETKAFFFEGENNPARGHELHISETLSN